MDFVHNLKEIRRYEYIIFNPQNYIFRIVVGAGPRN